MRLSPLPLVVEAEVDPFAAEVEVAQDDLLANRVDGAAGGDLQPIAEAVPLGEVDFEVDMARLLRERPQLDSAEDAELLQPKPRLAVRAEVEHAFGGEGQLPARDAVVRVHEPLDLDMVEPRLPQPVPFLEGVLGVAGEMERSGQHLPGIRVGLVDEGRGEARRGILVSLLEEAQARQLHARLGPGGSGGDRPLQRVLGFGMASAAAGGDAAGHQLFVGRWPGRSLVARYE